MNKLQSGSENTKFYKEQFESNSTANESLLYEQSIIMDCVSDPSSLISVLLSKKGTGNGGPYWGGMHSPSVF